MIDRYKGEKRLIPIKTDNEVFEKILKNDFDEIKDRSSRIYQNYLYFYNRLKMENFDIERLYNSFNNLRIIKMELGNNDNPQIIFESINSTGMSLSIADLIRNYLLMNETEEKQTYLFENYWYKFEKKLGVENLVLFFEHYLNVYVSNKVINRNDMYNIFKTYYIKNNFETEGLFLIFEKHINCYEYIITEKKFVLEDKTLMDKINQIKREIQILNTKVAYMFLLPLTLAFEEGKINEQEVVYGYEMTLSYILRRGVVGLPSNSMQKVFRYLFKQTTAYIDKYGFKKALDYAFVISKSSTIGKFPTDEEFFNNLANRNLYGKYKNLDYLLLKLENYENKTQVLIDNLTIEHIMPQTLTTYWKEVIGKNYKLIHEENVNDLGNLTLTSYNSNMSNFEFEKKRNIVK